MKKKPEKTQFKVGDTVNIPITDRRATIIQIVEKSHDTGFFEFNANMPIIYKTYTVSFSMPNLKSDRFHAVTAEFTEGYLSE